MSCCYKSAHRWLYQWPTGYHNIKFIFYITHSEEQDTSPKIHFRIHKSPLSEALSNTSQQAGSFTVKSRKPLTEPPNWSITHCRPSVIYFCLSKVLSKRVKFISVRSTTPSLIEIGPLAWKARPGKVAFRFDFSFETYLTILKTLLPIQLSKRFPQQSSVWTSCFEAYKYVQ